VKDTTIRAIGRRAHPLHSLAFFSSQSVVVASIGCVHLTIHLDILVLHFRRASLQPSDSRD
jgi:hypothetical protein